MASFRGAEERRLTEMVVRVPSALGRSPVSVYPSSYGGDKLFEFLLFKLDEESQIKIGTEKLPDKLDNSFLGDGPAGRGLHKRYCIRDEGPKTEN